MQNNANSPEIERLCAGVSEQLEQVRGSASGMSELAEHAVPLAALLLRLTREFETKSDASERQRLARMVDDPEGCAFTTLFTDRVPRTLGATAAVQTGRNLIDQLGIPNYFSKKDRALLRAFGIFGALQPTLAAAAVKRTIRQETARYLLPDSSQELSGKLGQLLGQGVSVNVNHLGEEILSTQEAEGHLLAYEHLLSLPEVDTVSVKISSICERISSLAFDHSLERISTALRRVYRAASSNGVHKLVMLDMEAYKDLELSLAAFQRVADENEFLGSRVGIVLQAYVPDSHNAQASLLEWAKARSARGGAPIRIRLVKGANLTMETVLEEQRGWTVPVYPSKLEVDASFKKMLETACQPEHSSYLIQGIASHNLFDIALTLLLRSSLGTESNVSFEILSGMAEPLKRTLSALNQPTLVYCPTVSPTAYHTAVAYLVRRLDENTTVGNFLCSGFGMQPGSPTWLDQKGRFLDAAKIAPTVSTVSRRQPVSASEQAPSTVLDEAFQNERDADFCLPLERSRLVAAIDSVRNGPPRKLRLSIAGSWRERPGVAGVDPSEPETAPYETSMATAKDVSDALEFAEDRRGAIASIPPRERARWLLDVAAKLRHHRFELVALIMQEGGKIAAEADTEVSEAIDFAEYYARTAVAQAEWHETRLKPRGITVVTPPWNFPLAIPLGGCFAALAAGNPAILKPAPETPAVTTRAVELCYEAGLPQEFLQVIVATDEIATPLITDQRVRAVILTGASDTARLFRRLRPDIYLLAETGGKNTIIVTEYADLDAAVSAIADSAFGHSGQKCSAASLLILQENVARESHFIERLVEATRSRRVGSVWDLESDQGPLIHAPHGPLQEAIERSKTEKGWVLRPEAFPDNPRFVSPGICTGVQAGSLLHKTELFGPVLGVMTAKSLESAIRLANDTPYGLTSGLMSLDEKEQTTFVETMDAGNLYVNRPSTGAIVQRQPFGGRKTSSFGPGSKAGGPNYTLELVSASDRGRLQGTELPPLLRHQLSQIADLLPSASRSAFWEAAGSYQLALREHFTLNHDPSGLNSQRNVFRYQPADGVLLWLGHNTAPLDLALSLCAIAHAQVRFDLAFLDEDPAQLKMASVLRSALNKVLGQLPAEPEDASVFAPYRRVRCIGDFPDSVHKVKNRSDAYFERAAPLKYGRLELLRYFKEQSISLEIHRYGNLQGSRLAPLSSS